MGVQSINSTGAVISQKLVELLNCARDIGVPAPVNYINLLMSVRMIQAETVLFF